MSAAEVKAAKKPLSGLFTCLAVILFLGGFYLASSMFLATQAWYVRLGVVVLSLVLSSACLLLTDHWAYLVSLARGARIELRKVFWPSKENLVKTTGMVLVVVSVFSIFLWIIDAILTYIVQLVL